MLTFSGASKLFAWNWGVPQFHKMLRVLITMPHQAPSSLHTIVPAGLTNEEAYMSLEKLFSQTTAGIFSTPIRETFVAPTLLPVCCICGLVRDDTGFPPCPDRWVDQRAYRNTHGVNPTEFPLTHTYCPECFTHVQEAVRRYSREIGGSL